MFDTRSEFGRYLRRSTPSLDAETRALIDRAVAEGRVKKVPPGEAATRREYVWDGKKLVQSAGPAAKTWRELNAQGIGKAPGSQAAIRAVNDDQAKAAAERTAQILDAFEAGKTRAEVQAWREALGEKPAGVEYRLGEILRDMTTARLKAGMTADEVIAWRGRFGESPKSVKRNVNDIARRLGQEGAEG